MIVVLLSLVVMLIVAVVLIAGYLWARKRSVDQHHKQLKCKHRMLVDSYRKLIEAQRGMQASQVIDDAHRESSERELARLRENIAKIKEELDRPSIATNAAPSATAPSTVDATTATAAPTPATAPSTVDATTATAAPTPAAVTAATAAAVDATTSSLQEAAAPAPPREMDVDAINVTPEGKLCIGEECFGRDRMRLLRGGSDGSVGADSKLQLESGIVVSRTDPGAMLEKSYDDKGNNRYGVGQYPDGKMRVYAAKAHAPASVSLSFATDHNTFNDVLKVDQSNGGTAHVKQLKAHENSAKEKMPDGWGGGIHSWDVYANGTIGVGKGGDVVSYMNSDGSVMVGGKLHVGKNDNTDPYSIEKIIHGPNDSSLRITVNDDPNESVEIWGDSCRSRGGCAGPGAKRHAFRADGDAEHARNLKVGGTAQASKLQLGDKWMLSGVGDKHANDGWLRLFHANEQGYHGGLAAGKLWSGGDVHVGNDVTMNNGKTIRSSGRMHIHPQEKLYLLAKKGTHVSRAWGGAGDLQVDGNSAQGGAVISGTNNPNVWNIKKGVHTYNPGKLIADGKYDGVSRGWSHLPWTDGKNYLTGRETIVRGGNLVIKGGGAANRGVCIDDVCITKADLKKLKG
jgi:hypothetical protein